MNLLMSTSLISYECETDRDFFASSYRVGKLIMKANDDLLSRPLTIKTSQYSTHSSIIGVQLMPQEFDYHGVQKIQALPNRVRNRVRNSSSAYSTQQRTCLCHLHTLSWQHWGNISPTYCGFEKSKLALSQIGSSQRFQTVSTYIHRFVSECCDA